MNKNRLLVFTDLDGTLLDHNSYSTEPASEALALLEENNIPLIFNTSKTRSETIKLRRKLHNNHPFATENGSCLSVPDGYFQGEKKKTVHTTFFGLLYTQIRQVLASIRAEYGFEFTGFGDMAAKEVAHLTGLSADEAVMAKDRDCSEPIVWADTDENLETFKRLLAARNMQLTVGGRFYHVFSVGDKGLAVHWLADYFHAEFPDHHFITIGLGDGINDLPMLNKVDHPILVRPMHGNAPDTSNIENISITDAPGPAGWNRSVINLVHELL
ncbi:HAD-IIB family hydrolase [Sansalvadorimonas sp. 2012CJ34-2]|uniref:HAD-IIB family hydrolase n=1 Tax=Parendozoicomonas callyspongiae TaxID=2942213 RepID=A0ABT0PC91_9GAMM|nr:HAD-IIB family hydrolase [Sansalvadorimonas sp. 2012CJ34-2]MCL6268372.1 HAD-IIB family hydrolase [Sansalvadorimonas sp. 2012CJ34-2]